MFSLLPPSIASAAQSCRVGSDFQSTFTARVRRRLRRHIIVLLLFISFFFFFFAFRKRYTGQTMTAHAAVFIITRHRIGAGSPYTHRGKVPTTLRRAKINKLPGHVSRFHCCHVVIALHVRARTVSSHWTGSHDIHPSK